MIVTLTPRAMASRRADITGGEVRFGVSSSILSLALEKRCRRSAFRGVGGGCANDMKGRTRKCGLRWCGDGRNTALCEVIVKDPWLGSGVAGSSAMSLRSQVCRQNRMKESTMGPVRGKQHSSQLSQLRLQLGRRTRCRSIITNFGCMTLKGRTKRLLTCRSSPLRSFGGGRPSESHFDGGYMWPVVDEVWKSFCAREQEEKQRRTRSLSVPFDCE